MNNTVSRQSIWILSIVTLAALGGLGLPAPGAAGTNALATTLPGTELIAERVYWTVNDEVVDCPRPGDRIQICTRLLNVGSDPTPEKEIAVDVQVGKQFTERATRPANEVLNPGKSVDVCTSQGHVFGDGLHSMLIQFDSQDSVPELDENNNVEATLYVGSACATASCGDGICAPTEDQSICARDCGARPLLADRYGYPHALFFRGSVEDVANQDGDIWLREHGSLMGIIGKAQDERYPRMGPNVPLFNALKKQNPEQLVLLHFSGNMRRPEYRPDGFFAGHWLYHQGAKTTTDVTETDTTIHVDDASLFPVTPDNSEDVALCEFDPQGRPNWNACEQLALLAVDNKTNTITVRRGQYGTSTRAFRAPAYTAAHHSIAVENGRAWSYNFSTHAPRDPQGRSTGDALAEDLAALFGPGGDLAALDGIQFDVLFFDKRTGRPVDYDGDGTADDGFFDGINSYGLGVYDFTMTLRGLLPDKIINADGQSLRNQRSFGVINGMESEGWPNMDDLQVKDWSGGINRLAYWSRFARQPVFNFINHKYHGGKPGFNVSRLVMAANVFLDSALAPLYRPRRHDDFELIHVWDEMFKGVERKKAWLGRPEGPAVRLAIQHPLGAWADAEQGVKTDMLPRFAGNAVFTLANRVLTVEPAPAEPPAERFAFTIHDLPIDGPDLLVTMVVRGEPWTGYPPDIARQAMVKVVGTDQEFMTWVGPAPFQSIFYFRDLTGSTIDLEVTVEGAAAISISDLRAYAHPDAMYRKFENGLVLANPSHAPYVFDLASLVPGEHYRRIKASHRQDGDTNNGARVGDTVTLSALDALFLAREGP